MPAANQFRPAALRIRSIGLAQPIVVAGDSISSISKSPLGASGTPVRVVSRSVKEANASQINVANTLCPVPWLGARGDRAAAQHNQTG
jgi:hypothetical protein